MGCLSFITKPAIMLPAGTSASITIVVQSVNQAPVVAPVSLAIQEGEGLSVNLVAEKMPTEMR
jgi:hypothetical protein